MESLVAIEGIRCQSNHGCMDEEGVIGGRYTVDVYIASDNNPATRTDRLDDTFDYGLAHRIVREEMGKRSRLIEHAGGRILLAMAAVFKGYSRLSVRITKFNPPVNGQVEKASVYLSATHAELALTIEKGSFTK